MGTYVYILVDDGGVPSAARELLAPPLVHLLGERARAGPRQRQRAGARTRLHLYCFCHVYEQTNGTYRTLLHAAHTILNILKLHTLACVYVSIPSSLLRSDGSELINVHPAAVAPVTDMFQLQ